MNSEILYAWFSAMAAESGCRVIRYRLLDGVSVDVTCVDRDPSAPGYNWPDKKCVGTTTKERYEGTSPNFPNQRMNYV